MSYKVFVTGRIPETGLKMLRARCDVDANEQDLDLSAEELRRRVADVHGVVALLRDHFGPDLMDAAPKLVGIANYAVGYNNIDVAAATERGLLVSNTPDVLTPATADLTWALLLSAARRIPEGDRFVRAGRFTGWKATLMLGGDVTGRTLGVVGAGRIGSAVAMRSSGFGMKVLYTSRSRKTELDERLGARRVELDELLAESDFVTLHVPLTDETRHLIGPREFALMKPTACLINTSRGPVVDEAALVEALRSRRIAGAGLDVFEREPELAEGLAELDNVVVAPHVGSATTATRNRMAEMAAENLLAMLDGAGVPNLVNPEALPRRRG